MRLVIARIACAPLAAALVFGAAALPARVGAQALPPYARPDSGQMNTAETIHGVIEAIMGPYRILVRDSRGFVDDVTLHRGTRIVPRGLRLAVGMSVTIYGDAAGSTFSAYEIDSSSPYDGAAYGASYYSYPDYGYGYGYGYGGDYLGSPVGSVPVVPPPAVASPPPVARFRIAPSQPSRPWRRPLDGQVDPPPIPLFAVPPNGYRAMPIPDRGPSAPDRASSAPDRAQAPAPQSRAPAPEYHAPPPQRSEPPPARENHDSHSTTKPH